MAIGKEDYIQWRSHPATEEFMQRVVDEMDTYSAYLIMSAGENPIEDRKRVGRIEGLRFLYDWEPEFTREEQDADSDWTSDSSEADFDEGTD